MDNADKVLNQYAQTKEEVKKKHGRKLRIGIIGTGGIARAHIKAYLLQEDAQVVALCDIIPGKAEQFRETWNVIGAVCYTDFKEMLDKEKLDGVSICTYNMQHCAPTVYALQKGVNVLLEKPFSVNMDEAVQMMRAEKESGKILTIGFQPRMDENMQEIKKIAESGVLGEIYYIQTGGGRRRGIPNRTFIEKKTAGVGALGDIGCYSLDMVLNAIGYPKPLTVTGYTSDFFGKSTEYSLPENACRFDVDDFAAAFIRLEGGIILDFRISWAMHLDTPGDTVILGKKGALRIPSTECWNGTVGGPMKLYHDVAGQQTVTEIPIIENKGTTLFERKIRSFMDAVWENGKAPVPTNQIFYNQAIICAIGQSAACGHEVQVELPQI